MSKNLWRERSVGIKLWGFDRDPYQLAKLLPVLSNPRAKGELHGSRSVFKENQIHILRLVDAGSFWDDALIDLVSSLGGVEAILALINSVQPKNFFVVVNVPISDVCAGGGNHLSKEAITILHHLGTGVAFNWF